MSGGRLARRPTILGSAHLSILNRLRVGWQKSLIQNLLHRPGALPRQLEFGPNAVGGVFRVMPRPIEQIRKSVRREGLSSDRA